MGNGNNKDKKLEREDLLTMDMLLVDDEDSDVDELLSGPNEPNEFQFQEQQVPTIADKRPPIDITSAYPTDSEVYDFDIDLEPKKEVDIKEKVKNVRHQNKGTLRNFTKILANAKEQQSFVLKPEEESKKKDSLVSLKTLLEYDYTIEEIRNLFLSGEFEEMTKLLWNDSSRKHNWLEAVTKNEFTEKEENFDYGALEKELNEAYGANEVKKKTQIANAGVLELQKKMLKMQNKKIEFLKEQTKLMNIRIKHRIKDLKKERKRKRKESKEKHNFSKHLVNGARKSMNNKIKKIGRKSRVKSSFISKKNGSNALLEVATSRSKASSKSGKLHSKSYKVEIVDEGEVKRRAEITELRQLRKALVTDVYFPGLLKWKVKSEVASGLFIGAKDIEVARIKADYNVKTESEKGRKLIIFDVKNLEARIGILELALKGSNKFTSALGGMVNPTVARLYLILKGAFRVHLYYSEEKKTWIPLPKLNKFKLRIQKETKGVKKIRLPTTLINLLGNIVIPKIITNVFKDSLPSRLEQFDDVFRQKLAKIFRDYGFNEGSVNRMMPTEMPMLASNLTDIRFDGSINIEGDLDFNVWRAPLIAPTKYAAAARKALEIDNLETAAHLDILLRSDRAKKAGFSGKTSATIEKLAVWRYKFGSYSLKELKPLMILTCGTKQDSENPGGLSYSTLFKLFERVEKLSKKPLNVAITLSTLRCTVDAFKLFQNIQQNFVSTTVIHAKTETEVDNAYEDVEDGLKRWLKIVKLRGEASGQLSLLSMGPLVRRDQKLLEANAVDGVDIGVAEMFGATMLKLQNLKFQTNLNAFTELKELYDATRKQLDYSLQAYERDNSKEYVVKLLLRDEREVPLTEDNKPKLPKRPKDRLKELLPGNKTKLLTQNYILKSLGELGILEAKLNMFAKGSTFGNVEGTAKILQLYLDNSFLDALIDDGRFVIPEEQTKAQEFVRNKVAPVLQKNGFSSLATVGGAKTKDLLTQVEILLRWLDGAVPFENNFEKLKTADIFQNAANVQFETKDPELFNLPGILQNVYNEFVAQVQSIPFKISSNGEVLAVTLSTESEERQNQDIFSCQLKFRMELTELLARE